MHALDNIRLSVRGILPLILPFLGLLILAGYLVFDRTRIAEEMADLDTLISTAPPISAVVHALQKERGNSAGFIGSKGAQFRDSLAEQRKETDGLISALGDILNHLDTQAFGEAFARDVAASRERLGQLSDVRAKIDAFQFSVGDMAAFYTGTIAKLLSAISAITDVSASAAVTKSIIAYTAFLQGKERAGLERAMGAAGFGAGKFPPAIYRNFISLIAAQEVFFTVFRENAAPDLVRFMDETMSGEAVEAVAKYRAIALDSIETGDTQGVKGPVWFDTITRKIDLMKTVEDRIAADLGRTVAAMRAAAWRQLILVAVVSLAVLVIGVIIGLLIANDLTRHVCRMVRIMSKLAQGNTDVAIAEAERKDEIGEMGRTIGVFRDSMIRQAEMAAEKESETKAREARQKRREDLTAVFDGNVSAALKDFVSATQSMVGAANKMSDVSEEASRVSAAVAAASEQATTNVEAVAAAIEELSRSAEEVENQVHHSARISSDAADAAARTNQMVGSLTGAADKIGEVVALITDIADQTNLLALNATIEAARAGEAGKGFAVVASEVKNLANQTAKATEDIAAQVTQIQSETKGVADIIGGVTETVMKIKTITDTIADVVHQQRQAAGEISQNVQQAAAGTREVSTNIAVVDRAAHDTGNGAQAVMQAADELDQRFISLRSEVEQFLKDVRT